MPFIILLLITYVSDRVYVGTYLPYYFDLKLIFIMDF